MTSLPVLRCLATSYPGRETGGVAGNFIRALLAIVAGNAVFFLLLSPRLPRWAQHAPARIDLGLVIDFWVCLTVWGALVMLCKRKNRE